jgi:predicted methyltransferase
MHFTVEAQRLVADTLFAGAIAVDATAGNGFDTQFLAERVGPTGRVIAIDIQPLALQSMRYRLEQVGLLERVRAIAADHAELEQIVEPEFHGQIACIMFNLGYLPLSDKTVITRQETTLKGIRAAADMLRPGGGLSILAYVGHEGGREEARAVALWVESQGDRFAVQLLTDPGNSNSPILWSLRLR